MLGDKLKELRTSHHYTQEEVAKRLKISKSTVGMYEQNRRSPDLEVLSAMADIYNVSLDYLLDRCGKSCVSKELNNDTIITWNKVQELYPTAKRIDSELQELIDYYEELSLKDKRWIMGQMIDLIKKAEGKEDFSLKEQRS